MAISHCQFMVDRRFSAFFFNVNMGRNLRHSVLEVSVRTRDHNLTNLESIDEWSVQNL